MNLDRRERKYVEWTVSADVPITAINFEVTFDDVTWHPLTKLGNVLSILVAGPEVTGNPGGTVVLALGTHRPHIRATDTPEILVDPAGSITVK